MYVYFYTIYAQDTLESFEISPTKSLKHLGLKWERNLKKIENTCKFLETRNNYFNKLVHWVLLVIGNPI